jgi:hypothetical protein
MAVSTARAISSTAAALKEKPLAQVIPFGKRRKPMEEPIARRPDSQATTHPAFAPPIAQPRREAQVIPFPQDTRKSSKPNSNEAEKCQGIKIASARESKAKGQTRRAEIPPDVHYLLAWLVWFKYVEIMQTMGIRVSESLRRVEFHDHIKRGR